MKESKVHLIGLDVIGPYGQKYSWTLCGKPYNAVESSKYMEDITCKVCLNSRLVPDWMIPKKKEMPKKS